jgi:hypothetical protein
MLNEVAAVSARIRYSLVPNGDPIDGMIDLSRVGTEIESPR